MEEIKKGNIQTELKKLSRRKVLAIKARDILTVRAIAYKLSNEMKRKYTVKPIINIDDTFIVNREK